MNLRQWAIAPPYRDGAEAIADHLASLNQRLVEAVARFRQSRSLEQRNGLGSVAIFDDEVDAFLDTPPGSDEPPATAASASNDLPRRRWRAEASAEAGIALPIENLRRRFKLGEVEVEALLHALAVELHPGYGRVFGYLNNDIGRQRPSVALIVDVLASTWPERLAVRRALGPGSALFRFGLLVARPGADHVNAELSLDAAVLDVLLGDDAEAPGSASPTLQDLLIAPTARLQVERIVAHLAEATPRDDEATVVLISGPPGTGRRTCAAAICQALQRRLRTSTTGPQDTLARLLRDARLAGDVPGIRVPRAPSDAPAPLAGVLDALRTAEIPLAFALVDADARPRAAGLAGTTLMRLHLDAPTTALRQRAWALALGRHGLDAADATLARIASVYPFNVGSVHAAAADAAARVRLGDAAAAPLDTATLARVCREQTDHQLERLADLLPSRHGWDDIVLPRDELDRLKEIANAVRQRDRVMDEWGFGEKVSAGRGVNAIFFGPSGTGKTMAASILAGELGMAIFRADLSKVVSKYIGETERNLDALFHEARRSYAVLFFDEAEALFGKRSEVKDAHDRYANIECAYLLQRMEGHDGVAILATNLRKHLDNAFLRRLQFAVEFPLPVVADRLRIWRGVWPKNATLAADVDLEFMATQLELAGGHIRNVAMTAAFLAAEAPGPIGMRHLLAATRREMQKLGRACVPEQFGRYAALLQGGPP